ncbi:unnamed protein product [Rotaria sp. Silwood1]|nr:unnamed protein product [Rotaria sp. Silwood1]
MAQYKALLITLHPLERIGAVDLTDYYPQNLAVAITYNRPNDMSIAVNTVRQMAIVGVPIHDRVLLLSVNMNATIENRLNLARAIIASPLNIGYGRSVAWINDRTVAISALDVPDRSWSRSEVYVCDVDTDFNKPLFVFPNHQQTLRMVPLPLFLHIISWSGNLLLSTDQLRVFLVPSRQAGFYSAWYENDKSLIFIFSNFPCLAGTFKNESSFGACTVCPPQTKNPGNQPCVSCTPCLPDSFCPMASVDDSVTLYSYPSYSQTFAYPDTPDMNNYDDLLIQNIFYIGKSTRCLITTPMFWTLLAIGLCFIVWLIMILIKKCRCEKVNHHRNTAKQFFKRTDIITEDEQWIGGLLSFATIVLFCFALWFATKYIKLYPIETSSDARDSCDDTLYNALFDNALQLPLSNPDGTRWPIFDMLDEQPFTMTLDLVNTRAYCSNISFQQNRPGVNYLRLPMTACILQSDNITQSVSVALLAHRINVQLNITGPYFVGGFRLCLHGPGLIKDFNRLHALDMCQFFSTPNQTLARVATLSVMFIKVVNQTKPLHVGDLSQYDGRWATTFAENALSDEMIYEQDGTYIRYMVPHTILTITFSEQPFFLQNNQKPVVRIAELAFHTLLFCTLVIELFALTFLVLKLISKPFIHLICCCWRRSDNQSCELPTTLSKKKCA